MYARKRGMGALVPAGAPFFRGQAPLLGTEIATIAGVEELGGQFGVSVPPHGLQGLDSLMRVLHPVVVPGSMRWGGRGVQGLAGASISGSSGGNAFRIGDSWRIQITGGKPNAPVYLNTNVSGAPMPMSGQQDIALSLLLGKYETGNDAVGTTDGAGNFSISGIFGPNSSGVWTILANVQGDQMPIGQFTVADASGSIAYTGPTTPGGTPYYQQMGQQPAITGQVPTAQILTLDQQLAALKETLLPTGQVVPISSAPPASAAGGGSTGSPSASHPAATGGAAADTSGTFDVGGFLTESVFLGIPNWILLAVVAGGFLLFGGHKH